MKNKKRSMIADSIDKEYRNSQFFKEEKEFRNKYCSRCKNSSTYLCEIRRNIEKKLQCIYFKEV